MIPKQLAMNTKRANAPVWDKWRDLLTMARYAPHTGLLLERSLILPA